MMRYLRLLAFIALMLLITAMVLSMAERSLASIACFVLAFIPLGIYCYILDRQDRETNKN